MKITRQAIARELRAQRNGLRAFTHGRTSPRFFVTNTNDGAREGAKDTLFPAFLWPGGYTAIYYDETGCALCAKCAEEYVRDERRAVWADTYDEGPDRQCDACGTAIESSYGDPWAEDEQ